MNFILRSEGFELDLSVTVYDEDLLSPVNTTMNITVKSKGFCADTVMSTDVYDIGRFAVNLNRIYETLTGTARIEEPYGNHMYLDFTGDGLGHISVSGCIGKNFESDTGYTLEFISTVDQTCIAEFSKNLMTELSEYI